MVDTVITVQGRFVSQFPPERATIAVSVGFEGGSRTQVFDYTVAGAAEVRESIEALHDSSAGPVFSWSSDTVQVWSSTPWNKDGKQLDPVFHSVIGFSVKFGDFDALARWVEQTAAVDGATIGHIAWDLTDSRRTAVIAEVRSRAVKDAVAKASVYAQSIGLGTVTAIALADPGMLGDRVGASDIPVYDSMRMASAVVGSAPELSLVPEEIEIEAVVDARFIAS